MSLLKNLYLMLAVLFGMLVAEQMRAEDLFMGEYEGTFHADRSQKTRATAKVIAEGPGYYRVVLAGGAAYARRADRPIRNLWRAARNRR